MSVSVDRSIAARLVADQIAKDARFREENDYLAGPVCERLGLEKPICRRASLEMGAAERETLRAKWHRAQTVRIAPLPRIGGEFAHVGDRFTFIADSDDQSPISTAYDAVKAYEQRVAQDAERDYLEHAAAETGMGASPEEVARQQSERSLVLKQSHELAGRLETAGKAAYRDEAFGLWVYWIHSKKWEAIPQFRRICLLPYVAAIVRASKLAALEFFLQRNPFARFWTFTSGKRVGLDDLRERVQWLHKRLGQLNARVLKPYGVQMVFRSTELGSVEFDEFGSKADEGSIEFAEDGSPLFHVHAHCVIISRVGFIHPAKWERLIADVWAFWGHHWDAGRMIGNARECCKYVTKPGDMLKLSPADLGRLFEALFRLKLCQPMGVLADEIRNRKAAPGRPGKTLRRYRLGPKNTVWREVWDQNAWLQRTEEEKEATFQLHDAASMAEETKQAAKTAPGHAVALKDRDKSFCRVFARLSPAVGPEGLKEPRVIVGGTHFDRKQVTEHPLVFRLWSQTVQEWEAGRAISVHTGTPTLTEPEPFDWLSDLPERVAPPGSPVFALN